MERRGGGGGHGGALVIQRLNIVLLLLLLVSAGYLVRTSYESRQLFTAQERAKATARQLQQDADRLDLERRAEGTHSRVDQFAREKLKMRNVTPGITEYVPDGAQGARP